MPTRKAQGAGHGWPMPTGATTPVVPMPISEAESERIVTEQTAPPTDHLYTGDQPGNATVDTTVPGSATAPPSATAEGNTPPATDRDVVARVISIIAETQGFQVREVMPTRTATTRITLPPGAAVPLVGYESGRRCLTVRCVSTTPTDVVYLGTGPDAVQAGFPIYAGENVELRATDELWIVADANNNASGVIIATLREVLPL